ncbi:Uncharacterised protein [Mycobacteroides abscessus subsp. abscessus]|nr:Uncharacterised protein [Mycobacteroides abscessus subsp. abscessus]
MSGLGRLKEARAAIAPLVGNEGVAVIATPARDRVFRHPADLDCEVEERGEAAKFGSQRAVQDFRLAGIAVSRQVLGRCRGEVYQFPATARSDKPQQPGEVVGMEAPEAVEVVGALTPRGQQVGVESVATVQRAIVVHNERQSVRDIVSVERLHNR